MDDILGILGWFRSPTRKLESCMISVKRGVGKQEFYRLSTKLSMVSVGNLKKGTRLVNKESW